MNIGELAVALFEVERDGAFGRGRAAAHFGELIFEAVRQIDARAFDWTCASAPPAR